MRIDNPELVLPALLVFFLFVLGVCAFILIRLFRRPRSKGKRIDMARMARAVAAPPPPTPAEMQPIEPAWPAGAPPPSIAPRPALTPPAVLPSPADSLEVFRVLRVGSRGELVVEVEGQHYHKITEIRDGIIGRRVLLAVQELEDFVGPHAKKMLPELHRLEGPLGPGADETSLSPEQLAFLEQLQGQVPDAEAEREIGLVEFWRQGFSPARRRQATSETPGPQGFIEQIEALLQDRLPEHPKLAGRSIHFFSAPTGELRIEVDGRFYDGMDAIPDAEVVMFIKDTIQAWEQG